MGGGPRWTRSRLVCAPAALLLVSLAALIGAQGALATSLTPGDVVVERDGTGAETLPGGGAAVPVFLDELDPAGTRIATFELPSSKSGSTHALVDSAGSASDGLITLSGNGECVLMAGYEAPLGTEKVSETKDEDPRVLAVINGNGEINTTTALKDFNENNVRSATSQECTKLYAGGAGNKNTGGVVEASVGTVGSGTPLDENITNFRQVEVVGGQLYASGNPEKDDKIPIGKVGTGLPTTGKQTITGLPFETNESPAEPYAYSMLTLGSGSEPDTIYVAEDKENGRQAVVKYCLSGGKWVEHGSVEIPFVTGVTANDVNGLVTIYATSSGTNSKTGTLYRFPDYSGYNGTLSAVPAEIANAPANEAWRGVAFAPGTTIGHGGTPPPEPLIAAAETALPAAIDDPTNPTMPITVEDPHSSYAPSELTVTVSSSKESVAPLSGITVSGSGRERTLSVIPAGVGESKLTLVVEAPDGAFSSTQITYGASEYLGSLTDRYYSGAAAASATISVGEGYMLVASDEENVINLYRERISGPPVPLKSWNFNGELPYGNEEANIHGVARAGNTLYWVGGMANTNSGEVQPSHNTMFATTITGSGATTELSYLGSYIGLREDLISWDNANGAPLGFAASTAPGKRGEEPEGFKIEGVEFAPGSSTEAYLTFRAPLEPVEGPEKRDRALVIPVTNFSSLFTDGNPGTGTHATFGTPLEWHLPCATCEKEPNLTIRTIRKNAQGEYILVASTANSTDEAFQLWGWDGETEDEPVQLNASIPIVAEGVWDAITSVPSPIRDNDQVEVLQDDSKTVWYGKGTHDAEKGLIAGLQKSLGRLITVEIPPPGVSGPPHLTRGGNPNKGEFTLRWKPAPTLGGTFALEHENAEGGWTTVASGLTHREYTFSGSGHESEDTWKYRVVESNETATAEASEPSESVKVCRRPPYPPIAAASREPDYIGPHGERWYKNSITVTFSANGDPKLPDGSEGCGTNPETLTAPETFETSGTFTASGTIADYAGNVSEHGTLEVKVDATPPSLEIQCPKTALVGEAGIEATVTASDAYSGLRTDPSGKVPISTSQAGPFTVTRTAVSNVGLETTKSCTTEILYPTPGAPTLSVGKSPNDDGLFTLSWTGADPLQYMGLSYTLQEHNAATDTWTTVATGIEALSYEFAGPGEEEGTWVFRVQGVDPTHGVTTEWSSESGKVVVDRTPPRAPSATASRAPEYTGGGGWYKDSVEVKFSSNGDPNLSDGSPGSGVNPSSIPPAETFHTDGAHEACGTVSDYAGNVSQKGCLTVQVESTPPNLEIECPATTVVGSTDVNATVTASDAYSGLVSDPSGTVPIDTSRVGSVTITRTAVSNLGLETTKSCTTLVLGEAPEIGHCVKVAAEQVGHKVLYHGGYTSDVCKSVSKKHNGKYEWESGPTNAHFTSNEVIPETLETTAGVAMTCLGETTTGEYVSSKTLGDVVLKFTGCELGAHEKCATGHAPAGKVTTETLDGRLGVYKQASKPAGDKIAIDLYPAGETDVMKFTCGSTSVSVQGSLMLAVEANRMLKHITLEGEQKKGKQKIEGFVGGPKDILEASVNGGQLEAAGLAVKVSLIEAEENGEELEVNAAV